LVVSMVCAVRLSDDDFVKMMNNQLSTQLQGQKAEVQDAEPDSGFVFKININQMPTNQEEEQGV